MSTLLCTTIYAPFSLKAQHDAANLVKTLLEKHSSSFKDSFICLDTCTESRGSERPGSLLVIRMAGGLSIELRFLWNTKKNIFIVESDAIPPLTNFSRYLGAMVGLLSIFAFSIAYVRYVSPIILVFAGVLLGTICTRIGDFLTRSEKQEWRVEELENEIQSLLNTHLNEIDDRLSRNHGV